MHRLRPIRMEDLEALKALASSIRGGLTTLPDDPDFLEGKIEESLRAFDPKVRRPGGEYYLFVLEDRRTGLIRGTSGILSRVGGFDPFYTYELRTETVSHPPLGLNKRIEVLHLKTDHKGPAEICSLFLHPEARSLGLGRLLSLGRFLFIAAFRQRFAEHIIAELRGWQSDASGSPFWNSVGRHFFDREFHEADFLSGLGNKDFIKDLMPRHPIYVPLLPEAVREVIGRVHPDTEPARRLLEDEGFRFMRQVDIFDAGPLVGAPTGDLRIIRDAATARLRVCTPPADAPRRLIARPQLDFRCTLAPAEWLDDGTLGVSEEVMADLDCDAGEAVLHVPAACAKSP